MRRAWSEAAEAKLAALYSSTPLPRLAFLLKRTEKAIRSRAKILGLSRSGRRRWKPAEDAALRARYPHEQTEAIARDLKRVISSVYQRAVILGLRKSEAFMASDRSGRVQRGKQNAAMRATQFPKGHAPANKGLRRPGWAPGRMAATQFKKGDRLGAAMHNYVPVGTEKVRDGVLCRKVSDDPNTYPANRWQPISRIVWEAANGPIPAGHAVAFKPGRRTTELALITLDALELVSRADLMRRNTLHRYPAEVVGLIRLKGALNRKINRRTKAAEEHA